MPNIINNLEKQLAELRELIQQREDKVDDMSEKWQESDKCEAWMDKTMDIEGQADELESIIDNLKKLIK